MFLLNAVKCNLTELTTRGTSFTFAVSGLLDMRTCQDSSCSWSIGRCSVFLSVVILWRLSLDCFLVFYHEFFCERFFHWAFQMTHIQGHSTNNSVAAMLDSDQPSSSAPSSGTNSLLTPAVPATTTPTFTL